MSKELLGGFPYTLEKNGDILTIRFYPKSLTAEFPNDAVLVLPLNKEDRNRLIQTLTA